MSLDWSNCEQRDTDPFEEIGPALLNSADIVRYIRAGCLIEEANFSHSRLKTASYELRFLGELHMWENVDGEGLKRRCTSVEMHHAVKLPKNSISYLWTKEELYLPEYIAARFNLHIKHVHKGLLVGTGPLIDPGFGGSLLIPLHNLTGNDYEVCGGDGIAWVEFTKVSSTRPERREDLKEFPPEKRLTHPNLYFDKAGVIGGVESAFKGALHDAQSAARKAAAEARKFRRQGWVSVVIGFAAIVVTVGGVWWTSAGVISDAVARVQDARNRLLESDLEVRLSEQNERIEALEKAIRDMQEAPRPAPTPDGSGQGTELEVQ